MKPHAMKPQILDAGCVLRALLTLACVLAATPGQAAAGGTLVAWGYSVVPPVPPGTRFKAIAAGGGHSVAVTTDGTVLAWGGGIPRERSWSRRV